MATISQSAGMRMVSAFDGTIDFGRTSGYTPSPTTDSASAMNMLVDPTNNLSPYIGTETLTVPRFTGVIPAGRMGWMKLSSNQDQAITGVIINRNANAGSSGAFNQGRNLHKLRLTTAASVTIPVFPPVCR